MKTTLILVIDHKKPIADLTDIAAGRIYTLDGVEDVTAELQPEAAIAEPARGFEAWWTEKGQFTKARADHDFALERAMAKAGWQAALASKSTPEAA